MQLKPVFLFDDKQFVREKLLQEACNHLVMNGRFTWITQSFVGDQKFCKHLLLQYG